MLIVAKCLKRLPMKKYFISLVAPVNMPIHLTEFHTWSPIISPTFLLEILSAETIRGMTQEGYKSTLLYIFQKAF